MQQLLCSKGTLHCWRSGPGSRRSVISRVAVGPEPPPERKRKPQWLRILEEDVDVDEDVAELLKDTGGDEDKIRAKMQAHLSKSKYIQERTGSDVPPNIVFEAVDPFNLWVWFWFHAPLTARDQDLLDGCLRSWYVCGKFGGFNSTNMQVYYAAGDDTSYLDYSTEELRGGQVSLVHDMGELAVKGRMARVRIDMGTADELALDVLINLLIGYSTEVAGIRKLQLGGDNEAWPAPAPEAEFEGGQVPKVSIDPLRTPTGLGDELELLDELEEFQRAAGSAPSSSNRTTPVSSSSSSWGASWGSKVKPRAGGVNGSSSSNGRSSVGGPEGGGTSSSSSSSGSPLSSTDDVGRLAGRGNGGGSSSRKSLREQLRQRLKAETDAAAMDGEDVRVYSEEEFNRTFNPDLLKD